jgi:hypothetical protein
MEEVRVLRRVGRERHLRRLGQGQLRFAGQAQQLGGQQRLQRRLGGAQFGGIGGMQMDDVVGGGDALHGGVFHGAGELQGHIARIDAAREQASEGAFNQRFHAGFQARKTAVHACDYTAPALRPG